MFFLRVHSVDADHPLYSGFTTATKGTERDAKSKPYANFTERRGIPHLFRSIDHSSPPKPNTRSTLVFIVAVPNYISFDEFLEFCGSRIDHVTDLSFIRNDGVEDRYSVLIELKDQLTADGFYCNFNGKKFSPVQAEVCHILFLLSVEYTESSQIAGTPPFGCTELPTCPVCLERFDADTSGIMSTQCDHSFPCNCVSTWTYLSCQVCHFCQHQDEKPTCFVCGTVENLWICVICGFVGCGRYKEGHAVRHWKDSQHCYSLDLTTKQIWDYVGDSYVHRLNPNQSKNDGKLGETNFRCVSFGGDCGACECSEDSGITGALLGSKVEAIVDEYNHLLATQMETQRQYYESLLVEARSKMNSSISETVEEAVTSRMQDIQNTLDKCTQERDTVAEINRSLIKDQQVWQKMVKEIEEREIMSLKLKDEKILDLEEQVRDLKIFLEAQKTIDSMADSDSIKEGKLLPVAYQEPSVGNNNRKSKKKSNRRRN